MINLEESHDSQIVKQAGLHINNIESLHRQLEMFALMGDAGGVIATSKRIQQQVEKVAEVATWAFFRDAEAFEG